MIYVVTTANVVSICEWEGNENHGLGVCLKKNALL